MFAVWFAGISNFLFVLLGLIAVQFVLGVSVAIFISKDFEVKKLPDFLASYLPKVLAWLAIELLALIPPDVLAQIPGGEQLVIFSSGFGKIVWGLVALASVGGILGHLQAIGVMPGAFTPRLSKMGMPSSTAIEPTDQPMGGVK